MSIDVNPVIVGLTKNQGTDINQRPPLSLILTAKYTLIV